MARVILHVDMDAFFAAIEQLDHPEFRGKPVVVGADPKRGTGRGVVSTCSYEARVYGIHSAMPISTAYRLCPNAIYVLPRGHRYVQVSRQVMKILENYSPLVEQVSIDEAFLDITSSIKFFKSVKTLALDLKRKIREATQLTASVGISPNKFIAKIASDLKKPDGLVIVGEDEINEFLFPLDISRLWGVGKKTLPLLQQMGIRTIGDLAQYSQENLVERFGKIGLHFWRLANGRDDREVANNARAKSISKEITFDVDQDNFEELRKMLLLLSNELAHDMRLKAMRGKTVVLKIRFQNFQTFTRSKTLEHPLQDSATLFRTALDLFQQFEWRHEKIRLLGVGVSHLLLGEEQLELFENGTVTQVDRVLDQVRQKFGEQSITRASLLDSDHEMRWFKE